MKRLSTPSGEISSNQSQDADQEDMIVRPAILVHSGPDGEPMVFQSADGPIEFDAARIQRIVEKHNAMIESLAAQYGGIEKMPIGAFPPILDQHENDSSHRVNGRLNHLLTYEVRDVPGVGSKVSCAMTHITFLGKDVVSRVKDGRIYHLSIGIDEGTDTLGETSTVITPAAPGAMLLKKANQDVKSVIKGEQAMSIKLASEKRMAKLAAMKESLSTLGTNLKGAKEMVRLTNRQGEVTHRLMNLMSAKKMTPAEFKKVDIKKLAKLDDESLSIALSAFEAREMPVINPTQKGSTMAADFSEMGKQLEKRQMTRLKAEIMGDIKKLSGKKLGASEETEDKEKHDLGLHEKMKHHMDEKELSEEKPEEKKLDYGAMKAHLEKLAKHLAAGEIEDAKKCHAEMSKAMESGMGEEMKHMEIGDVKSEDYQKSMGEVQKQVDELHTQMARIAGMVDELMAVEKEEGHDLEEKEKSEDHAEDVDKKKLEKEVKEEKEKA